MLWKRVLSAAIPLPPVLALLHFGPTWGWGIFITLVALIAMHEYLAMTIPEDGAPARWVLTGLGAAACWGFYALHGTPLLLLFFGAPILSFLYVLARPREMETAFRRAAYLAFGFLYAPLLLAVLIRLHAIPDGREWIYVAFLVAWGGDTCAYFAGRAFGRHKLYPAVSPKKTIEGAIGGLAGSFLGVLVASLTFFPGISAVDALLVAVPGGILGQIGDLAESLLKRSVGVKDSGAIMPGHGGILDRVDALMFILPFVYAYATLTRG